MGLPPCLVRRGGWHGLCPSGKRTVSTLNHQDLGVVMHTFPKELLLAGAAVGLALAAPPVATAVVPGAPDSTTVTVRNDRPDRVTMYLEQGDFDLRLGTVEAKATVTLHLPEAVVREQRQVEIFAHPEGAGFDLAGQSLPVEPGGHLDIVVPSRAELAPPAPKPTVDVHPGSPATTVMVENGRDEAVVIFAETGEFDTRLGTVAAHQTVTLRIPDRLAVGQTIELFVHPEEGFDLATQSMPIRKGAHLHLLVPRKVA